MNVKLSTRLANLYSWNYLLDSTESSSASKGYPKASRKGYLYD